MVVSFTPLEWNHKMLEEVNNLTIERVKIMLSHNTKRFEKIKCWIDQDTEKN